MRYAAFISYRHVHPDRRFAIWLHRAMESYRLPKGLRVEQPRLGRVFRDEDELAASADLGDDIRAALRDSEHLVVICSPQTPESRWITEEIRYFVELGRADRVSYCLIDGTPESSFPVVDLAVEDHEPLAADARPERGTAPRHRRHTAKLKLIAALAGLPFDDLRRREVERRNRRLLVVSSSSLTVAIVFALLTVFAVGQRNDARRARGLAENRLIRSLFDESRSAGVMNRWVHSRELVEESIQVARRLKDPVDGPLPGLRMALADARRRAPAPVYSERLSDRPLQQVVFYDHDDKLLVAGDSGVVRIVRARTGESLAELRGHAAQVTGLDVSTDGALAVSTSVDGEIRVWNLSERKTTWRAKRDDPLRRVRFMGNRSIVGAGSGGSVHIIDLDTRSHRTHPLHTSAILDLQILADGRAVTSATDGTIKIWTIDSGRVVKTANAALVALELWEAPGRQIYGAFFDSKVRAWKFSSETVFEVESAGLQPRGDMFSIAGSTRHGYFATGHATGGMAVWRNGTFEPLHQFQLGEHTISKVAVGEIESVVAAVDLNGHLHLCALPDAPHGRALIGHCGMVRSVDLQPGGHLALSSTMEGWHRIWHVASGRTLFREKWSGRGEPIDSRLLSDYRVLTSNRTGQLYLWDFDSHGVVASLDVSDVRSWTVGANERFVVAGTSSGQVWRWDLATFESRLLHNGAGEPVISVSAAADRVRAIDTEGRLISIDPKTSSIKVLADGRVEAAAFSADGQSLVLAEAGRWVLVDTTTYSVVASTPSPLSNIVKLWLDPRGRLAVGQGLREDVHVIDLVAGRRISTISNQHSDFDFDARSGRLITGGDNLELRIYDFDGGVELRPHDHRYWHRHRAWKWAAEVRDPSGWTATERLTRALVETPANEISSEVLEAALAPSIRRLLAKSRVSTDAEPIVLAQLRPLYRAQGLRALEFFEAHVAKCRDPEALNAATLIVVDRAASIARLGDRIAVTGDGVTYFLRSVVMPAPEGNDEAIVDLSEAIRQIPHAYLYHQRAMRRMGNGEFDEAMRDLDAAVTLEPNYTEALIMRGQARPVDDPAGAIVDFDRALALDSSVASVYRDRASRKRTLGRFEEALADLDRCIQMGLVDALSYRERGSVLQELERYDEAIRDYTTAVELEPASLDDRFLRANLLQSMENFEEVRTEVHAILAIDPDNAMALTLLVVAANGLRDLDLVITTLGQLIELQPSDPGLRLDRAGVHVGRGELERAMDDYRQVTDKDPKSAEAHYGIGTVYLLRNNLPAAVVELSKAIDLQPVFPRALTHLAWVSFLSSDYAATERFASRAIAQDTKLPEAYNFRGLAVKQLGRINDAKSDFEKAMALRPDPQFQMNLANTLAALDELPEALALFDALVAEHPDSIESAAYHCDRAGILLRLDRTDEAMASYARALKIVPGHTVALINRGDHYQRTGRPDKAVSDFTVLLKHDPENLDARVRRANAHRELGQWKLAVADYDQCARLGRPLPSRHFAQAQVRLSGGDDAGAIDSLRAFLEQREHLEVRMLLARIQNRAGRTQDALKSVRTILKLDAAFTSAYLLRASILMDSDPDRALQDYGAALGVDNNLHEARIGRAIVRMNQDQFDEAVSDLDPVIAEEQFLSIALPLRGLAHQAKGRLSKALADFTRDIEAHSSPSSHLQRAKVYNALGEPGKALTDLKEAARHGDASVEFRTEKYRTLIALEQLPEALNEIDGLRRSQPGVLAWWWEEAKLRRRIGQEARAVELGRAILAKSPDPGLRQAVEAFLRELGGVGG